MRAVGYVRVSTSEQADSGLGLEAQRAAIVAEAARRGWQLLEVHVDAGASGKSLRGRDGLAEALAAVERRGGADVLVVAKLDRLSRSVHDFAGLMARAQRGRGWSLVALDLGVDTTTPTGRLVANVMASVAEWERETIGQRTRDALAVKRSQGARLGRPRTMPAAVLARIVDERARGLSLAAIADGLAGDGVPTVRGGTWRANTVRAALRSVALDEQAAAAGASSTPVAVERVDRKSVV